MIACTLNLLFPRAVAIRLIVFRKFCCVRSGNWSRRAIWTSFASCMLAAIAVLSNGLHLVSPGSSLMSSTSAISISGLWEGELETEMTLGDEMSIAGESSGRSADLSLSTRPTCVDNVSLACEEHREEELLPRGSRTLMVTLLGVRAVGGSSLALVKGGR